MKFLWLAILVGYLGGEAKTHGDNTGWWVMLGLWAVCMFGYLWNYTHDEEDENGS